MQRFVRLCGRGHGLPAGSVLFLVLTLAWFAPTVTHLSHSVLRSSSDASNAIREMWVVKQEHKTPFTLTRDPFDGAPEGYPTPPAQTIVQPVQGAVFWALDSVLSPTATLNLIILFGFWATATAMFALLTLLRAPPPVAFFGGYVAAFNPWMFEHAFNGDIAFVQGWTLIAVFGAGINLLRRRTLTSGALLGLALGYAFFTAAYFGLLAATIVIPVFAVDLLRAHGWVEKLWDATLASVAFACTSVFLVPGAVAYLNDRGSVRRVLNHPLSEISSRSATAASYLLPSHAHPVFGSITRRFLTFGWDERTLYFGYTTLALALFALVQWRRGRTSDLNRTALLVAVVVVPVALLLSLPRHVGVGGHALPTLSDAVSKVTSFYRFYARAGYVVGLAETIAAAVGLTYLVRRFGSWTAIVAVGLVAFELIPGRTSLWNQYNAPPWDTWLRTQPAGIVAEYPLPTDKPQALALEGDELFYQQTSRDPIYNLFGAGTGGTREDAIRILSRYITDPATPGILAAEHVRYVLLHDDVYRAEGETPPVAPPQLRLVRRFPGVRVYVLRSDTQPTDLTTFLQQQAVEVALVQGLSPPSTVFGRGFSIPFAQAGEAGWRKLTGAGLLELQSHDPNLRQAQIVLRLISPGVARTLRVYDPTTGTAIGQFTVGTGLTQITLGPFDVPSGTSSLSFAAIPSASSGPDLLVAPPLVQPVADTSVSLAAPG